MKDDQTDQRGAAGPANPFTDPAAVAAYAQNPPRLVPGFAGLQCMTTILLAERAPDEARVLQSLSGWPFCRPKRMKPCYTTRAFQRFTYFT